MGMTERSERRGRGEGHRGSTAAGDQTVLPALHGPHSSPQAGAGLHWGSLGGFTGPAPQYPSMNASGRVQTGDGEGLQSTGVHEGCTVVCVKAGGVQVGLGCA